MRDSSRREIGCRQVAPLRDLAIEPNTSVGPAGSDVLSTKSPASCSVGSVSSSRSVSSPTHSGRASFFSSYPDEYRFFPPAAVDEEQRRLVLESIRSGCFGDAKHELWYRFKKEMLPDYSRRIDAAIGDFEKQTREALAKQAADGSWNIALDVEAVLRSALEVSALPAFLDLEKITSEFVAVTERLVAERTAQSAVRRAKFQPVEDVTEQLKAFGF